MRNAYLFLLSCFIALVGLILPEQALASAASVPPARADEETFTWESKGNLIYVDGFFSAISNYVPNIAIPQSEAMEVEYEEAVEKPGLYRLKNPYANYSIVTNGLADYDTKNDYYFVIHMEDPDFIWTEGFDTGVSIAGNKVEIISNLGNQMKYGYDYDWIKETYSSASGELDNGILTFPPRMGAMSLFTTKYSYYTMTANQSGNLAIKFPGYIEPDYSLDVDVNECVTDGKINVKVTGGADIADIYVRVAPELRSGESNYFDKTASEGTLLASGSTFTADVEDGVDIYTVSIAGLNSKGKRKAEWLTWVHVYKDDKEGWRKVGVGTYTDALLTVSNYTEGETYPVIVEEKEDTPNFFRIVNPLKNSLYAKENGTFCDCGHDHYMYIDATDPEAVSVKMSSSGLDLGYGNITIWSILEMYAGQLSAEELKRYGYKIASYDAETRTISFPKSSLITCEGQRNYNESFMNEKEGQLVLPVPGMPGDMVWESRGKVTFVEDFFSGLNGLPQGEELEVEIEESFETPGLYRLKNPYAGWSPVVDGTVEYDTENDYYFVIHAEDPEWVWAEGFDTGVSFYNMMAKINSNIQSLVSALGVEEAKTKLPAAGGELINGIISFPPTFVNGYEMPVFNINAMGQLKPANTTGLLKVRFPGYVDPDYSLSVEASECVDTGKISLKAVAGADLAALKVLVAPGAQSGQTSWFDRTVSEGTSLTSGVTFTADVDPEENVYTVSVVGLDARGKRKAEWLTWVHIFSEDAEEWHAVGDAIYTDAYLPALGYGEEENAYTVALEQNISKPKYFRIVNPFAENQTAKENGVFCGNHDHYIYIDVTDPDAVNVRLSSAGLDMGNGNISLWSVLDQTGLSAAEVKQNGYKVVSYDEAKGIIYFPANSLYASESGRNHNELVVNTTAGKLLLPAGLAGEITWESRGTGILVEGFFSGIVGLPRYEEIPVKVEEADRIPGLYRLVNPYINWSAVKDGLVEYDYLHNYYYVIHAEDPDFVWGERFDTGVKVEGSMCQVNSNVHSLIEMYGIEEVKGFENAGGDIENGVIWVPTNFPYMGYPTFSYSINYMGSTWGSDNEGRLRVKLPDCVEPDYALDIDVDECESDDKIDITITGGSDLADIRILVMPESIAGGPSLFQKTELEGIDMASGDTYSVDVEPGNSVYTVSVVGLDANARRKVMYVKQVYILPDDKDQWKEIGTGQYEDPYLSVFKYGGISEPYDVLMEQNVENPKMFRIVNPFRNHPMAANGVFCEGHDHYLYLDISDPKQVRIPRSPSGFDMGNGIIIPWSVCDAYHYTANEQQASGYGVITYDRRSRTLDMPPLSLLAGETEREFCNFFFNFQGNGKLIFPESNGIDLTTDDEAPVEWFDLTGIKVSNPGSGVYIMRQGGTSKITRR